MRRRSPQEIIVERFGRILGAHDFASAQLLRLRFYRNAEWSEETFARFEHILTLMEEARTLLEKQFEAVQRDTALHGIEQC